MNSFHQEVQITLHLVSTLNICHPGDTASVTRFFQNNPVDYRGTESLDDDCIEANLKYLAVIVAESDKTTKHLLAANPASIKKFETVMILLILREVQLKWNVFQLGHALTRL